MESGVVSNLGVVESRSNVFDEGDPKDGDRLKGR